jgi:cyanophycinase-like exopeptidase
VYLVSCASHDGTERINYLRSRAQSKLGAMGLKVFTPLVIDRESANDPENATLISEADWIYFSGGHPHIGMQILKGSLALKAVQHAARRGVLISGSSAGAMILCGSSIVITPEMSSAAQQMTRKGEGPFEWQIPIPPVIDCFGFVPDSMCWPHMNRLFSLQWSRQLLPNGHQIIGIDEQTAAVREGKNCWKVRGQGSVLFATQQTVNKFPSGTSIHQ